MQPQFLYQMIFRFLTINFVLNQSIIFIIQINRILGYCLLVHIIMSNSKYPIKPLTRSRSSSDGPLLPGLPPSTRRRNPPKNNAVARDPPRGNDRVIPTLLSLCIDALALEPMLSGVSFTRTLNEF